jgi:iron(III) transport system substrate-binding protein
VNLVKRSQWRAIVAPVLSLSCLAGCGGGEGEDAAGATGDRLVVYVSADDFLARQVIDEFERESGIRVERVGDTEINKTTGLANRIRAERDNPQADVFWSSEAFMMIQLADEGLLEPFEGEVARDWPTGLVGANGLWHGFGSRARVIAYSPLRVPPEEIPHTWMDLTDPKWRGRIVMADPRFGTTRGHMGALRAFWGAEKYQLFLDGIALNDIRWLTSGNAGVVQAVASGEADIGLTDTDDVWAARRNGLDVDLVYPAHGERGTPGEGTLLIPNTVAIVKGTPNRGAAQQFVTFLLSERVARLLVESDSHNIPVQASLASEYPQFAVTHNLDIDLAEAASQMDEAVRLAMEALERAR